MDNKRNFKRHQKKLKSEVHSEEGMTFSTSVNISDGGIFIATTEPLEEGTEVTLSVQTPEGESVDIKGVVKWKKNEESTDSKSGMGIEFKEISNNEKSRINDVLK